MLLMVISQQSMSTLELVEALKRQNVVFEGGHGIIFRFLQQLELQGYLRSEKKLRRGRELKVYSATEDVLWYNKRRPTSRRFTPWPLNFPVVVTG